MQYSSEGRDTSHGGRSERGGDPLRRTTVALLMIGAAICLSASMAAAQSYGTPTVGASNTNPAPGETITVSGSGCPADFAVDFLFDGTAIGSTTSDSTGA